MSNLAKSNQNSISHDKLAKNEEGEKLRTKKKSVNKQGNVLYINLFYSSLLSSRTTDVLQ